MRQPKSLVVPFTLTVMAIVVTTAPTVGQAPLVTPLTEAGQRLRADYASMLAALRGDIGKVVPSVDEQQRAAFLRAYAAEAAAKSAVDAAQSAVQRADKAADPPAKEAAARAQEVAERAFVRAQEATLTAARPILADAELFLTSDALDARLVRCAVLASATPRGLAEFAQRGAEEEALLTRLLADDALMQQMLVADGARAGQYGPAMQIYSNIQQASGAARAGILQRLALGTSLEHAVPVKHFDLPTTVDPVQRYLSYERAYRNGELDPAFENMNAWECRLITNCDAPDEQIEWGREMLRNYRPDVVFEPDYRWRYAKIVKTDVAYKSPEWTSSPRTYPQIIRGGGKCGPRAWFGRFALRCFGIPTWGVRQQGHAALSHWTPDGWVVNFGAAWRFNWWEGRPGPDFLLETQAREHPADYRKVLRAQWVGTALGEEKVDAMRPGSGGLWHALALYQKKAIVADGRPAEKRPDPKQSAAPADASVKATDTEIVVDQDGVIDIPAVACSSPRKNTAKISFMRSFAGGSQLHYSRLGGKPEDFEYAFEIPTAGRYALVARVVTVNTGQQLRVTANDAEVPIDLALPYTVGRWEETAPVRIDLRRGRNVIRFTCQVPNHGLSIKNLTLTPLR